MDKINSQRNIVRIAPKFDVSITQCLLKKGFSVEEYRGTDDAKDTEHFRGALISKQAVPRKGLNLAYTQKGHDASFITVIECHSAAQKIVEEKYVKNIGSNKNGEIMVEWHGRDNKE